MTTLEIVEALKHCSNPERLEVLEAVSRLIREDLGRGANGERDAADRRLEAAANRVKDLYAPGGELTEWTALDAEEFIDETR